MKLAVVVLAAVAGIWGVSMPPRGGNYLDTLPVFWSELYPGGGETLYCGKRFRPFDRSVNVEHVFPMSWVTRELGCGKREQCRRKSMEFNRIESDMHNLYPARKDVNQARSAYAFAMVKGEKHAFPSCDLELDHKSRRAEPRPEVRGNIARAMLYMADTYELKLYRKQQALLLEWHKSDPPDAEERRRNQVIEGIQGRGNSYIE